MPRYKKKGAAPSKICASVRQSRQVAFEENKSEGGEKDSACALTHTHRTDNVCVLAQPTDHYIPKAALRRFDIPNMGPGAEHMEVHRAHSDVGAGTLESAMTFKRRFEDDSRGNLAQELADKFPLQLRFENDDSASDSGYVSESFTGRFERNQQESFSDLRASNRVRQEERLRESQVDRGASRSLARKEVRQDSKAHRKKERPTSMRERVVRLKRKLSPPSVHPE